MNALAPGMVKTELWDSIPVEAREGLFKKGAEGHLTGTIGHPDDVSQWVQVFSFSILLRLTSVFAEVTSSACRAVS